jgi:hypothetical protein
LFPLVPGQEVVDGPAIGTFGVGCRDAVDNQGPEYSKRLFPAAAAQHFWCWRGLFFFIGYKQGIAIYNAHCHKLFLVLSAQLCGNMEERCFAFYSPIMPAPSQWLPRLPEIIGELKVLAAPVLDRALIEKLFALKRRQAIDLCHRFGGFQAGRTFLVDRLHLIAELERIHQDPDFEHEINRKQRLSEMVVEARRLRAGAQVVLPVSPEALDRRMADLPDGIRIEAGRLTVEFQKPEDLLGKLFELAKAAHNDYETFCTAAEKTGRGSYE